MHAERNQMQTMYLSIFTLEWQHFSTHRQMELEMSTSEPSWPQWTQQCRHQNPWWKIISRVAWWTYMLCNAQWWKFHMPTNLSIPQWVELYSLHCNIGIKLLLIICIMITMIMKSIKSKRIISLINHKIQTMRKNEVFMVLVNLIY